MIKKGSKIGIIEIYGHHLFVYTLGTIALNCNLMLLYLSLNQSLKNSNIFLEIAYPKLPGLSNKTEKTNGNFSGGFKP